MAQNASPCRGLSLDVCREPDYDDVAAAELNKIICCNESWHSRLIYLALQQHFANAA